MDPLAALISLLEQFLEYLHGNVSSIPFTISFAAAILLTAMYLASLVSSALIRALLIPVWVFSIVTYFFPALIPKDYEFMSLVVFAAMVGTGAIVMRMRRKPQQRAQMDTALSEIVDWMRASQMLDANLEVDPAYLKRQMQEILRRNKIA